MKLAKTLFLLFVVYYSFTYLFGDVQEGYCGVNSVGDVDCSIQVNAKSNMAEGVNPMHMYGYHNSVSSDDRYNNAPESLKGVERVFKYPNYYGYGAGGAHHYGEPYYLRTVNY